MPSIKEFIEAMSSSWPVALAIFLGSGAVLVGDAYGLEQLADMPGWLVGTSYMVAAFAGAVLTVALLRAAVRLVLWPFRRARVATWRNEHVAALDELPPEEIYILIWALVHGRQVVAVDFFDERVKALHAKGYLSLIPGNHHTNRVPYQIPDHIWKFLKQQEFPEDMQQKFLPSPFRW